VLDEFAVGFLLRLIPVFLAVEVAPQIVSVGAPCHAGHHGHAIAVFFPRAKATRQVLSDAVDHDGASFDVDARRPAALGLEDESIVSVGRDLRDGGD
jgi:hypothetical protein